MNRSVTNAMIFAMGVIAGSLAAWQYAKKKYERIAQEEIDSVKEVFLKKETAPVQGHAEKREGSTRKTPDIKTSSIKEKPDLTDYTMMIKNLGYTGSENQEKRGKEEQSGMDKPYVITPEEFGEFEDYERISLTYYADQILADDDDELIENVEEIVGFESLSHFGEYEDDSVFVRNDRLKCDYEILLDQRDYIDACRR